MNQLMNRIPLEIIASKYKYEQKRVNLNCFVVFSSFPPLDYAETPFEVPADSNWFVFLLKWPITFLLWLSVPDCRKHPRLTMLAFALCIMWIGLISYVVAIVITIIGT